MVEGGHQRRRLAEIAPEMHDLEALVGRGDPVEHLGRAVGGAVIGQHDLPIMAELLQRPGQMLMQGREIVGLVQHGDQDGELGDGGGAVFHASGG